jgi:D-alanyl-D-alanine carboxypeptidase (penicillin-binding protein 5/6)
LFLFHCIIFLHSTACEKIYFNVNSAVLWNGGITLNDKKLNEKKKKTAALALICIITAFATLSAVHPTVYSETSDEKTSSDNSSSLNIAAKSAVLMDAVSGTVLYEQDSHTQLPPASVTKVMTMLLICEAIDSGRVTTDDTVTISDHAASMGGSQMYMEPGETHTLDELLTGISMVSANDACVAAAEYISGSSDIFVENMNKRAAELGMKDTHFVNTNGLPVADHYTSAYDIAVMSSELLKHDVILDYLKNQSGTSVVGKNADKQTTLEMVNTNKLLRSYNGAIGIKTGFTQDAGYCLSAAAERSNLRLVAVVLGCESSAVRFSEAARLLDYGFANYEAVQIADKNELVGSATVDKGMAGFTDLRTNEKIQVLVPKGGASDISFSIVPEKSLSAPVKEGQKAGVITVTKNGEPIAEYELSADTDINKADYKTLVIRSIEELMKG